MNNNYMEKIRSLLFGVAIGDALGVPFEFKSRAVLKDKNVSGMVGYGTHDVPPGTFSDDTSLTFCLAEALTRGFSMNVIAENFIEWGYSGYWTARGDVFDIGFTTQQALSRLEDGVEPEDAGGKDEESNGNGSLMRISPLIFNLKTRPVEERFTIVRKVSSITHGHIRSVMACFYYVEFGLKLLDKRNKFASYQELKTELGDFFRALEFPITEVKLFERLLTEDIFKLGEDDIQSSGYVLHTLEASIWCILTTDNFRDAVLKAVNLGGDTDTTAAVTGGLAGLLYGYDQIPDSWLKVLARSEDIADLAERMHTSLSRGNSAHLETKMMSRN